MLKHKQHFKHICAQCGKGFMNCNHLETHQNGHMDVKPFECYKCRKGFCSKSALKHHQASLQLLPRNMNVASVANCFCHLKIYVDIRKEFIFRNLLKYNEIFM